MTFTLVTASFGQYTALSMSPCKDEIRNACFSRFPFAVQFFMSNLEDWPGFIFDGLLLRRL